MTSGTSEAYGLLLKVLADPGQKVLVPRPGYPLLEHLAPLEGIVPLPYRLESRRGWPVSMKGLEDLFRDGVKAFVAIQPHNPTGSVLSPGDLGSVLSLCETHGAAFVSDEVFRDYGPSRPPAQDGRVLTFRLGGLSKSLALPQLKLSWIQVEGPEESVEEALSRLEFAADAYLSVGTPVQKALPGILGFADIMQSRVRERLSANRKRLGEVFTGSRGVRVWDSAGGWYALIELPEGKGCPDDLAVALLEEHQVAVHPGSFYDLEPDRFIVTSLLPEEKVYQAGLERMAGFLRS